MSNNQRVANTLGDSILVSFAGFVLHTLVAYACALRFSQWLVFHWFQWVLPLLGIASTTPAPDWYLQHFEIVTTLPPLILGYVNLARFFPAVIREHVNAGRAKTMGVWAWILPTSVLLYRVATLQGRSSVLFRIPIMERIQYFFDIQKIMPTVTNPLASDPERVWVQLSVTAPFYAGVAYSLGALCARQSVLQKLFTFGKHQSADDSAAAKAHHFSKTR